MTKNLSDAQKVYLQTALFVGIFAIIGLGWLYWVKVYNSPSNIFYSMLNNSLATNGVTKTVKQEDQQGNIEQTSQAQFGARNLVDTKTTITQPTEAGDTTVVTQTIGTGTDNFMRYVDISVPDTEGAPAKDFSGLTNVWGKQGVAESGQSAFSEMVFGAVLIGNLPADKRQELLDMINQKQIYTVDYAKVETKTEDGRTVIAYPVTINTKAYIELLQRYDEMLGLKLMGQLSAESYEGSQPISVKLVVDKASRNLVKIDYGEARQEKFIGYGIQSDVALPDNPVSQEELQVKLQEVLYGE